MQKIWYIVINGNREGPFSIADLKRDKRITPDTLIWKEGFKNPKPVREIPELKKVFEDEAMPDEESEDAKQKQASLKPQEELVLDLRREPPYFFWILIVVIVVAYFLSQLYWLQ